jgi:predicted dehydrogenase
MGVMKAVLIGTGGAGVSQLRCLSRIKGVAVAAVCDSNEERARVVARQFKIRRVYTDISEMLQQEKPQVVFIATPPATHAELAIMAMEAGAHVFIEKPMALSVSECDQMIIVSQQTGRLIGVNHNRLFLHSVKEAKELLASGALGGLTGINIVFLQRAQPLVDDKNHWAHRLPLGVFGENLPHALYLARAFCGEVKPIAAIFWKHGSRDWMKVDEARLELSGEQCHATVVHSFNAPCDFEIIDLFGTRCNVRLVLDSVVVKYGSQGLRSPVSYALNYLSVGAQIVSSVVGASIRYLLDSTFGYKDSILGFLEAVRRGDSPPVGAEDGRAVVQMMEEILRVCRVVGSRGC